MAGDAALKRRCTKPPTARDAMGIESGLFRRWKVASEVGPYRELTEVLENRAEVCAIGDRE